MTRKLSRRSLLQAAAAKAGAKYFVALANHHDNQDTFNSKYHGWNTMRVGPKKDIVGTWEKAARARGLRFGISNHGAHAWHWYQPAYGYDAEGPYAGQRYDASMAWNGGKLKAVLNAKVMPPEWRAGVVEDVERGFRDGIEPLPWQTDTCLGDWHYARSLFDNHQYKPASTVIHRLCDIVSKNGNLLLSVPLRGDGTIDADERTILEDIATWMARNGEAIYGTRPWRTFGEGPTKVGSGMFSEGNSKLLTAEDIRFTTKGGALYAIALGWPKDGVMRIQTLAQDSNVAPGAIDRIEAVGSSDNLPFKRTRKGLEVKLPEGLTGSSAFVLKIRGNGLTYPRMDSTGSRGLPVRTRAIT